MIVPNGVHSNKCTIKVIIITFDVQRDKNQYYHITVHVHIEILVILNNQTLLITYFNKFTRKMFVIITDEFQ